MSGFQSEPEAVRQDNVQQFHVRRSVNTKKALIQRQDSEISKKPPPKDYLREMKSKRDAEGGKRNHHGFNGAEIDKVLKS